MSLQATWTEMNRWICNTTGVAIFDFLEGGGGTVEDYLKSNGLYPSSTYFLYLPLNGFVCFFFPQFF